MNCNSVVLVEEDACTKALAGAVDELALVKRRGKTLRVSSRTPSNQPPSCFSASAIISS